MNLPTNRRSRPARRSTSRTLGALLVVLPLTLAAGVPDHVPTGNASATGHDSASEEGSLNGSEVAFGESGTPAAPDGAVSTIVETVITVVSELVGGGRDADQDGRSSAGTADNGGGNGAANANTVGNTATAGTGTGNVADGIGSEGTGTGSLGSGLDGAGAGNVTTGNAGGRGLDNSNGNGNGNGDADNRGSGTGGNVDNGNVGNGGRNSTNGRNGGGDGGGNGGGNGGNVDNGNVAKGGGNSSNGGNGGSGSNGNGGHGTDRVGICHATGSARNPYRFFPVDDDATGDHGHGGHEGDIFGITEAECEALGSGGDSPDSEITVTSFVAEGATAPTAACGQSPWASTTAVDTGDRIWWCARAVNAGEDVLTAVAILAGLDAIPSTPCLSNATLPIGAATGCVLPDIAKSGLHTSRVSVTATGTGGTVGASAAASYTATDPGSGIIVPDGGDASGQDPAPAPVAEPGISLDKSADASEYSVGDEITYTYVITNTGETTVSSLSLNDDVLGDLTDELATRTLASGASTEVTVTQVALIDHVPSLTNVAIAAAVATDAGRISATDRVTVAVSEVLGVVIENPVSQAPAPALQSPEPPVPSVDPTPTAVAAPVPAVELPRTGTDPFPAAALAAAMLILGAVMLRRPRPE